MKIHENKFSFRKILKKILYFSGAPYLLAKIVYLSAYCTRKKKGVVILCYHSINNRDNAAIFPANIVDTNNFSKQLQYLTKNNFNVISLEYYLENHRKLNGGKYIVITFDDGYKDNFTHAYPVLKKYRLPATVFLASDYINTGRTKIEDKISYSFSNKPINMVRIRSLNFNKKIHTKSDKNAALEYICYTLNKLDKDKRKEVISELNSEYGIESEQNNDLMLTWNEIKSMDRELISFGSHSTSHNNLTTLSNEARASEISDSKTIIEDRLGTRVKGFSYPLGFFDNNIISTLRKAGYKYAVTTVEGMNEIDHDVFKLKRIPARNNYSLFKFSLICQSGTLYNLYSKLANSFFN